MAIKEGEKQTNSTFVSTSEIRCCSSRSRGWRVGDPSPTGTGAAPQISSTLGVWVAQLVEDHELESYPLAQISSFAGQGERVEAN